MSNECYGCVYWGKPADAPESVIDECMWEWLNDDPDAIVPPCLDSVEIPTR